MSWTAPMTAVSNTAFTAAQFNTYVRDNLMETAPAKASATGQLFVSTGVNGIAARTPASGFVGASESTTATTYSDLTTAGPSVSVTTGTAAIVCISAGVDNSTSTGASSASFAVSGATTVAASNSWRIVRDGITATNSNRYGITNMQKGLNPGVNTFTMKYLVGPGSTATFESREIVVIPL